ncbi:probable carboxylesterase 18 [Andrographis paniculata]|uniref:probable carboxylesterase 18 n=1 Tax=Andrographis paniculata TaxID=175694 RepID=UPI0021E9A54A|nr:probable carboxylesterase 18 [Andrographis paniculata]
MGGGQRPDNLPLILRLKLSVGSFLLRLLVRPDGTVRRRLLTFIDTKIPPNSTAVDNGVNVSAADISVDPSRNLWFRLFAVPAARATEPLPLIIYFHGGGFAIMSPDSRACDGLCRTLAAELPAVVASVNYRLTPDHKYPCQYDDGFDALQFIAERASEILPANTDTSRCFLAGDSAGGNIAHHVALRASENPGKLAVAGIVAVQPFFGGEERTESELRLSKALLLTAEGTDLMWRMFLPAGADRDHPAANVLGGREAAEQMAALGRFPRSMVVVGGYDPLQDRQRKYAERLKECGKEVELVEFPDAFHGFYSFPELPEFPRLVQHFRDFLHHQ